ncbi:DUF4349 domain-containing protein [Candidatus Woesearchaeota archaeon]|nr:DUF4349 domain-containing protein [Candidatus Woesearchaeota archaeon]
MTMKEQFKKLKENWLLIVLFLAAIVFFTIGDSLVEEVDSIYQGSSGFYDSGRDYRGIDLAESVSEKAYYDGSYPTSYPSVIYEEDFAPETEDRKITTSATIYSEVKRGEFKDAEAKLKNIVTSSKSFLLSENVNKYDEGSNSYYQGNYQLKVDVNKYESIISQLKEIGKVITFNANSEDITGTYTDLRKELEAEKSRLIRFEEMYTSTEYVSDKIQLTDRMFELERTIKYLQESIDTIDSRVSYSTIYVSLTEKQSDYAYIALVQLSDLIRNIVSSFNDLLIFLFWVIPYAIAGALVWLGVRWVKRRR